MGPGRQGPRGSVWLGGAARRLAFLWRVRTKLSVAPGAWGARSQAAGVRARPLAPMPADLVLAARLQANFLASWASVPSSAGWGNCVRPPCFGGGRGDEGKEWFKGFPRGCRWEAAAVATGTARAGFSGSHFSPQPFCRGQDSGGPSWLKAGRDQGNSECGTGRASDGSQSRHKRGTRDQGGRSPTKHHVRQRKSLGKDPGGLTGHPVTVRSIPYP